VATTDASSASQADPARGRTATRPEEIPRAGWRDILLRVKNEIGSDHVTLVSAGLAMYALLAVFPGLAAAVSIYGLFATPADVVEHMKTFAGVLPPGTWELFADQLQALTRERSGSLSAAALVGIGVALWSARSGMASLMTAANIAYSESEKRSFVKQVLLSLLFTLVAIAGFLFALTIGVAIPVALAVLGTQSWIQIVVAIARWGLLWILTVLSLAALYRYGPARQRARWRWVSWGSVIAATLWLTVSVLFAVYVRTFGTYGQTYGALAAVVVLLLWFYLSSFVIVLGAEINAEMERQTLRDTTEGPEAPLGRRGAYAADTVGPTPPAQEAGSDSSAPRDRTGNGRQGNGKGNRGREAIAED
jgi:membrane protein